MTNQNLQNNPKSLVADERIDALYKSIAGYLHRAQHNILCSINIEQVKAYWLIGRDIVEEEQRGRKKAKYGIFLLQEISSRLSKEFGRGFSVDTLERARKFYLLYSRISHQKSAAVRRKLQPPDFSRNLGWIHYRALI
ncbi:MAG: DUF1016 N-terminal domain-containing protein [Gammaproteobacteria bacterium]